MSVKKIDEVDKRVKEARKDPLYDKMIGYHQMHPSDVIIIDPKVEINSDEAKFQAEVWQVWQTYLTRMGRKRTLKVWRSLLATGNKLTLPCADPIKLDPNYQREFGPRNRYWDR